MIWACTETSSALVGSSAMISSGFGRRLRAQSRRAGACAGEFVRVGRRWLAGAECRPRQQIDAHVCAPQSERLVWVRMVSMIWAYP